MYSLPNISRKQNLQTYLSILCCCLIIPLSDEPLKDFTSDSLELHEFVCDVIGDDSVNFEIVRLDSWVINDIVAKRFSSAGNNPFLFGDTAHRHPGSSIGQ